MKGEYIITGIDKLIASIISISFGCFIVFLSKR